MSFRKEDLKKVSDFVWEIPVSYDRAMNVPGRIYASAETLPSVLDGGALDQIMNVAALPGIVKHSFGMPDIHWGYGFPIGGVAAFDMDKGVISPGGVGFDINCGVRLAATSVKVSDIKGKIEDIVNTLYSRIPLGVGSTGSIKASKSVLKKVLEKGSRWAVENGFGKEEDIEKTEEMGQMKGANADALSKRAYERGENQIGTLGSGNHFIELQEVTEIYDKSLAEDFGLFIGQMAIMIHSGSRGLGYQVCDDFIRKLSQAAQKYGIKIRDRQLVSAPVRSPEGKEYFSAMSAAANYAWANRQVLMSLSEKALLESIGISESNLRLTLVYDVAHNIAKIERHNVDGKEIELCVHRKGATRAFPQGHTELGGRFKKTGQPVIIPGSMGTSSYLLVGTERALTETFGSVCHGAGRLLSRSRAIKTINSERLRKELNKRGISVRAKKMKTLSEEAPASYKNIDDVVEVVARAGLAKKVVKLKPLGVIKG
ncbi:MAG: RtcB family protein [Candidatus Aureabacteria bacterium]|nr:RtcB family protein [Candidatus Auribacterota bacterium]